MWNAVKLQRFFLKPLLKKSMSSTEEIFQIYSSVIHDMIIDTKNSFI